MGLATTRTVRKRLDLERPVARELVEECLRLAQRVSVREPFALAERHRVQCVALVEPHRVELALPVAVPG